MSISNYIEVDGVPRLEPDILKWGEWFETAERHVGRTQVGNVLVSTVFLAIDHNWSATDPRPVLYETMAFDDEHHDVFEIQDRYRTRQEALEGHRRLVEFVRKRIQ